MNDTTDVCEIFIAINENGDWVVGTDDESTMTSMCDDFGGSVCRMVSVRVHINRPRVETLEVTVPTEAARDRVVVQEGTAPGE